MFLGYNTNGLAHNDLNDAIELLHDLGYRGVGITIDHHCLNPLGDAGFYQRQLQNSRRQLETLGMRSVIETGCRFLLDPRTKHEPTLITADAALRQHRIEFLRRAIDTAVALNSDAVSLWAGVLHDNAPYDVAFERLCESLAPVIEYAEQREMPIAFEPEPGMLIDTMDRYAALKARFPSPQFQLTIDVGHLHCQGETPIADWLTRFADDLINIHIEDMVQGVHEHLMFGDGEIDFPPIFAALKSINYHHGLYVELSRHSHAGPTAAKQAMQFLKPLLES
ncbi:MAG: sugar phosphate isomerase/epimerase [bacterium]|nr:sugar phosphate isomerase/epimerase [bacterium]